MKQVICDLCGVEMSSEDAHYYRVIIKPGGACRNYFVHFDSAIFAEHDFCYDCILEVVLNEKKHLDPEVYAKKHLEPDVYAVRAGTAFAEAVKNRLLNKLSVI